MFSLSTTNAFGLDISEGILRLVKIEKLGKKFIIASQNEIILPPDTMPGGDIKKPEIMIAALKKLVNTAKGKKIHTNLTITALPEPKTFIKLLRVSAPSLADLPKSLIQEMEKHIPFSMDEIFFDWQIIGNFTPNKSANILVGAAPIAIVNSFVKVLKGAGLLPLALEVESASITRAILPMKSPDIGAKIIIDMGASRTSLILYDKSTVQLTMSLPIAGNDITQKIAEKLQIDPKKAEKAKILCGLDDEKCKGVLKTILMGKMSVLTNKIEETVAFYQEKGPKNQVTEILLCGNGSNLVALDSFLQEKFKIPVHRANPLQNISKIEKNIKINAENHLAYTSAIGLALRAFEA